MVTLNNETLNYLISFLLGIEDAKEATDLIAYTPHQTNARIQIIPSSTLTPNPTLTFIEGTIPVFHGTPDITRDGHTTIIHADLIATAFFLLSRYDEYIASTNNDPTHDTHGRFTPDASLLGRNDLLQTPVLDLYTDLLYRILNIPKPIRKAKVYLTHDIDTISLYRRPRSIAGALYRTFKGTSPHPLHTILKSLVNPKYDPAYTFPTIQFLDSQLPDAEIIYFLKPNIPSPHREDRPIYNPSDPLLDIIRNNSRNSIGLHSLYLTLSHPETLPAQSQSIDTPTRHRAHYLRILPPQEMFRYVEAGITDDFSLAYASTPGFRLGTTRPTRAIDPHTRSLLPLTLHPLTLMDTTLSDPRYLNLSYNDSIRLSLSIINTTLQHHGDITLLFHNTSFDPILYSSLLHELRKI